MLILNFLLGLLFFFVPIPIIIIINHLKRLLAREFEFKILGPLMYFLGMEVAWKKDGILVSQAKYMLDLLQEIKMFGCKAANTPTKSVKKGRAKEESSN